MNQKNLPTPTSISFVGLCIHYGALGYKEVQTQIKVALNNHHIYYPPYNEVQRKHLEHSKCLLTGIAMWCQLWEGLKRHELTMVPEVHGAAGRHMFTTPKQGSVTHTR
jgi:hypothetical protein